MPVEIRCSINLDNVVNTVVGVSITWQVNGMDLNVTDRSRALQPVLVGDSRYSATLQFDTLSSTSDSGNYMCAATVYPDEATSYITNSTAMAAYTFTVTGV